MAEVRRGLRDFEVGETFTAFVVIRRKELRTRRDGQPFLVFEFGDRSGRLSGNIWEDADRLFREFDEGGIVKIRGVIELYQGSKQIAVKLIRRAKPEDEVSGKDFIPVSTLDPDTAFEKLVAYMESIGNPFLKALVSAFFTDDELAGRFKQAPAGKLWHHNRIGGLVEHTLSLCRLCRILARLYPPADRDLLTAGAILHDIGKIEEYHYQTHIDYTDRGRLVGHISLGAAWVIERAAAIEGFQPDLLDRLVHLVLSHQGEFGSPVQPATREAFLLHYADLIDSKMDALNRIESELGEGERWKWVNLLGRFVRFERDDNELG